MKSRLSARLLLMAVLPLVVSFAMFVLALGAFNRVRGVVVEVQEEKMQQMVALASSSINRLWIAPRIYAAHSLSQSPTLSEHLARGDRAEELYEEWSSARSILEGTFYIYYALEDGSILHYPPVPLPEGFDPRTRPWYKAGIASPGGTVWSPPYEEVVTGETLVSAVTPLFDDGGNRIGVFSMDVVLEAVETSLEGIELPRDGEVFLLNRQGLPFVGTDEHIVEAGSLPAPTDKLIVDIGDPLSSGWRVAVVVPRQSLTDRFARVRQPMVFSFGLLAALSAIVISWLVGSLVSRTRRLAAYFDDVTRGDTPIHLVFRTRDEFHYLNKQFNRVILDARHMEERRLSQERRFRLLVERAPIGFFRTRLDGSVIYANDHLARLLGRNQEELYRLPTIALLYRNRKDRNDILTALESDGEVRDRRIQYVQMTGKIMWLSINAVLTPPDEGESERHIEGFVVDVTTDMAERENLKRLSETDPLTGIANRRSFNAATARLMERSKTFGDPVGLILFDVDHFKRLNDNRGHDLGDAVLRLVSSIGTRIIRRSDLFARIGGDEFAILLPGATEEDAYHLGCELRKEVEAARHSLGLSHKVTVSVGVGCSAGDETDLRETIKIADNALYAAKNAGRNCVRRASECCR